jgi:hypothetical protein
MRIHHSYGRGQLPRQRNNLIPARWRIASGEPRPFTTESVSETSASESASASASEASLILGCPGCAGSSGVVAVRYQVGSTFTAAWLSAGYSEAAHAACAAGPFIVEMVLTPSAGFCTWASAETWTTGANPTEANGCRRPGSLAVATLLAAGHPTNMVASIYGKQDSLGSNCLSPNVGTTYGIYAIPTA